MFKADTLFFTPGSLVADHREPADRLMLVAMGSLDLFVYPPNSTTFRAEVICLSADFAFSYLGK